jgi:hypothetical protein
MKRLYNLAGVFIAALMAGLLGRNVAEIVTKPIGDELTKLVLGIIVGICIGLGTGFVVRRAWGRLAGIFSKS